MEARTLHFGDVMPIDSARAFFDAVAARRREPRLADVEGSWQFDVEGVGTWKVTVDHGALEVDVSAVGAPPTTRIRLREDELVQLARGDQHENLFAGMIRGAVFFEGELAFGQKLQAILPIPEDWSTSK